MNGHTHAVEPVNVVYPAVDSSVRHELELLVGGAAAPDYADVPAAPGVETLLSLDDVRRRLTRAA